MSYVDAVIPQRWNILFGDETTFNAALADASVATECNHYIGDIDENPDIPQPKPDLTELYALGSSLAKPSYIVEGKREYKGSFTWNVQNGQLLKNIFGAVSTTVGSPAVGYNTSTFTTGTAAARPLPSIAMAIWYTKSGTATTVGASDIAAKLTGVKLPKVTFSFNETEVLKAQADIWGCSTAQIADATTLPTVPTLSSGIWGYSPYMMKMLFDGTNANKITMYGAQYARIVSGTITIDHNPTYKFYGNSGNPYAIQEGRAKITCELDVEIEDRTIWENQIANPTTKSSTILIGFDRHTYTGITDDSLLFTLSNCYPEITHKINQEYASDATLNFKCLDIQGQVIDQNNYSTGAI